MKTPKYKYEPIVNQYDLILGKGKAVIVTGWLDPKIVEKALDINDYTCIGTLYNVHSGLTPFFINMLANPYTYPLILLSCTKQDKLTSTTNILSSLIKNAYTYKQNLSYKENNLEFKSNKDIWTIKIKASSIRLEYIASISKQISIDHILNVCRYLYRSTVYIEDDSVNKAVEELKKVFNEDPGIRSSVVQRYADPVYIEIPKPQTNILPSGNIGHTIKATSVLEAYIRINKIIRKNGEVLISDKKAIQELVNVTSIITPNTYDVLDDSNYHPLVMVDKEYMINYLPTLLTPNKYEGVNYTYGQRIFNYPLEVKGHDSLSCILYYKDQIKNLCSKLSNDIKENSTNTQLYLTLWNVDIDTHNTNPPCLVSIHLRLIDNKVHMVANFRSHDVYGAYFANVLALLALLADITYKINDQLDICTYNPGTLIINSFSAHIYESMFNKADELVDNLYETYCIKDKRDKKYNDPIGNFIIKYKGNTKIEKNYVIESPKMEVTQTDTLGKEVAIYEGYLPQVIVKDILEANPSIEKEHLVYLTLELDRCYNLKDNYRQH
jgi:thymidylate synthase